MPAGRVFSRRRASRGEPSFRPFVLFDRGNADIVTLRGSPSDARRPLLEAGCLQLQADMRNQSMDDDQLSSKRVPLLLAALAVGAGLACNGSQDTAVPPDDAGTAQEGGGKTDASGGSSSGSGSGSGSGVRDSGKSDSGGGSSSSSGSGSNSGSSSGSQDAGPPSTPAAVPSDWSLVLDDEFDGTTLKSYWQTGTNLTSFACGSDTCWTTYIPAEGEYLTDSMVSVQDETLILSTMKAASPIDGPQGTKDYISGYVVSYDRFHFDTGYIEFRVLLPQVASGANTGLWPALWLYNNDWNPHEEIDVLESFGLDQSTIQSSLSPNGQDVVSPFSPGWHTVATYHDPTKIAFYVDNKLAQSFDQVQVAEYAILMGEQLSSSQITWQPPPDPTTWPGGIHGAQTADLKVDWVHVWAPQDDAGLY